MKIDFNQVLYTIENETMKKKEGGDDATLGWVAIEGLLGAPPHPSIEDQKMSGEEKLERYRLAKKIKKAEGPIDVSSEQIVKIKKCVASLFGPSVSGQAWELLESKTDNDASSP